MRAPNQAKAERIAREELTALKMLGKGETFTVRRLSPHTEARP